MWIGTEAARGRLISPALEVGRIPGSPASQGVSPRRYEVGDHEFEIVKDEIRDRSVGGGRMEGHRWNPEVVGQGDIR